VLMALCHKSEGTSSVINGHILVLNLHSMCTAHGANLGKTSLLFWFLNYIIRLPTCLVFLITSCSSVFLFYDMM